MHRILSGHIAQGADCSGQGRGTSLVATLTGDTKTINCLRRRAYEALCPDGPARPPLLMAPRQQFCSMSRESIETAKARVLLSKRSGKKIDVSNSSVPVGEQRCTCRSISLIIEKNLWSCGRGKESRPGLFSPSQLGEPLDWTDTRINGCYTRSSSPLGDGVPSGISPSPSVKRQL